MATPVGSVSAGAQVSADGKTVAHSWEDISGGHLWENAVREDADGRIVLNDGADTLPEVIRKRRRQLQQNDYSQRHKRVVRDMIRYLYLVIDGSRWVRQKDPVLPPGQRLDVIIQMCFNFVNEFYDQNPLSHLGFVLIKNGEADILSPLSGTCSARTHKLALQSVLQMAATEGPNSGGEFSLQNGLEVAGRSLGHQPRHGSREIVIITAALSTCDPGYILTETLPKLTTAKIRVSCFALSAELHICRKLTEETNGTMSVCYDKAHFRDWLVGQTVPPPSNNTATDSNNVNDSDDDDDDDTTNPHRCEMIPMGFPTRTTSTDVAVLVHATRDKTLVAHTSYTCPQCQAKNYELPTDCAVCHLKLVLAPHLARSYHHLFPVQPFIEPIALSNSKRNQLDFEKTNTTTMIPPVTSSAISAKNSIASKTNTAVNRFIDEMDAKIVVHSTDNDQFCYACLQPLNIAVLEAAMMGTSSSTAATVMSAAGTGTNTNKGGENLRFQCPNCHNYFCVDCDMFLHESLHNCPGCLCLPVF